MHRSWFWVVLLFSFSVLAGPKEDALEKRKAGDKASTEGNYEAALRLYDEAFVIFADPQLLLSKASMLLKLRRYVEARENYQKFLDGAKKKPKDVEKAIKDVDRIISTELSCESSPAGATVYLDSRVDGVWGVTPFKANLAPGKHRLIFEKEGFTTETVQIDVKEASKTDQRVTLQIAPLSLSIESKPSAATVLLDGVAVGKTPLQTQTTAGTHNVELQRDDYQSVVLSVKGEPGEKKELSATLQLLPSELLLSLSPSFAVFVLEDGKRLENGSHKLTAGTYSGVVQAPGYTDQKLSVVLPEKSQKTISAKLVPWGGLVEVKSSYLGSKVWLDGALMPALLASAQVLPIGAHKLRVEAAGAQPYEATIDVRVDEKLVVDVWLQDEASRAKRWKRRTALGFAAIAAASGSISLLSIKEIKNGSIEDPLARQQRFEEGLRASIVSDASLVLASSFFLWSFQKQSPSKVKEQRISLGASK